MSNTGQRTNEGEDSIISKMKNGMNRRDFLYTAGLAGAAVAAAPILSACASETPEAESLLGPKRKMVYNSPFIAPWEFPIIVGARDFCTLAGWDFVHTGVSEYSIEIRLRTIAESVALQPDMLITNLNDPALGPPLIEALEKGMKVMIEDGGDVPYMTEVGLPFMVGDGFSTGKKYARATCALVESRLGKTKGTILVGDNNPGIEPVAGRIRGIEAAVPEYNERNGTNFTTLVFPDDYYSGVEANYARYESMWTTEKDNAVALITTGTAPGLSAYWRDLNFTAENRPIVSATFDATEADYTDVKAGYFDFLTYTNYYGFGWLTAAFGWQWLERGFPPENILVGGEIIYAKDAAASQTREKIWQDKGVEYGLAIGLTEEEFLAQ